MACLGIGTWWEFAMGIGLYVEEMLMGMMVCMCLGIGMGN